MDRSVSKTSKNVSAAYITILGSDIMGLIKKLKDTAEKDVEKGIDLGKQGAELGKQNIEKGIEFGKKNIEKGIDLGKKSLE